MIACLEETLVKASPSRSYDVGLLSRKVIYHYQKTQKKNLFCFNDL